MTENMKVVIACDSFKGCLTSREAGEAAAEGVRLAIPEAETIVVPVADGGEGTVDALVDCLHGYRATSDVKGPLGDTTKALYGICGATAVIEIAEASGLTLIPAERRNPWLTSSYGTGQLIRDALQHGCRNFLIGLGGSATNDGGTGMLRALGYRFLDKDGRDVGDTGGDTADIVSIDVSGRLPELEEATFTVACDVTNPLIGPNGASHVFGRQKGADSEMARRLDNALTLFAAVTAKISDTDFSYHPGAGAAGGLGFAFLAFLKGNLKPGIEMVLDTIDFDAKLPGASIVITGEGHLDSQTCMGKTPYGVLRHAAALGIPVIAIGGAVDSAAEESLLRAGFDSIHAVTPPGMPLERAMHPETAIANIKRTVAGILADAQIPSSR